MSRVANSPVAIPAGLSEPEWSEFSVKGKKGELRCHSRLVALTQEEGELKLKAKTEETSARALAGTMRALVQNMVIGVTDGFEKS